MSKIKDINLKKILSIAIALCIGGSSTACTVQKDDTTSEESKTSYSSIESKKDSKGKISEDVLFYISKTLYGIQYYAVDYEKIKTNEYSELNLLTPQQKDNLYQCVKNYTIYMEAQKTNDEAKMSQAISDMVDAIDSFGDLSETLAKTLKGFTVSNDDQYIFGTNLNAVSIVENEDYDAYLYMLYYHNPHFQISTNNYKGFAYGNPRYVYYGEDSIDRKVNEFNVFLHLLNKFQYDPIYRLEDISGNSIICNREMFDSMVHNEDLLDQYDFSGVFRKCTLSTDKHGWVLKSDDNILRIIFNNSLFQDLNELAEKTGQTSFDYNTMKELEIADNVFCDVSLKRDMNIYRNVM